VKFNIKADKASINGCNGTVEFPEYKIEKELAPGDNIIEFTPDKVGTITYTCWMGMIRGKIEVVEKLDASPVSTVAAPDASAASASPDASGGLASGNCCAAGALATQFANGKIPEDDISVAKIVNGKQELTVTVNEQGYAPAVLVVQKGVDMKIKFNPEKLNSCNSTVLFPDFGGVLDLSNKETETPYFAPEQDFTFQCGMNMLHGYVKVVDDINNIDTDAIKNQVSKYIPDLNISGCCGY
jgi:plastocyanin domain-containing protein